MTARTVTFLLLPVIASTINGCAAETQPESEPPLVVGLTGKYPPLSYTDENGELTGFDVDFANEVCRELRRRCEFRTLQWDGVCEWVHGRGPWGPYRGAALRPTMPPDGTAGD